jgi:hypothetical protein
MIKQFSSGDTVVRPFKTFKHWEIQSVDMNGVDQYGRSTYFSSSCEVNIGKNISSIFYPTGSSYYNSSVEPVNPSGKYYRNVFNLTDSMFYRYSNNPMEKFGIEYIDSDPVTGNKEVRNIGDRIVTCRIKENLWGEKIVPNSIDITDNSNVNETYRILDDGATNLFVSGSLFIRDIRLGAVSNYSSFLKWNPLATEFYIIVDNVTQSISTQKAKSLMSMGVEVSYTEGSGSWVLDNSFTHSFFDPSNERFGQSVSTWGNYILVGSPMDSMNLSPEKQGYAAIYKIEHNHPRLLRRFYSIQSQNALTTEYGNLIEFNGSFFGLESSSSFDDSFGYSVCVRDNFMAIGAPTGSVCYASASENGFVYVYDRFKGGCDNWGQISILTGSSVNDRFGHSVSLSNDILAVGAPGVSGSTGAVYIFRRKRYMDSTYPCQNIQTSSLWPATNECGLPDSSSLFSTPSFVSGNFTWIPEAILTSSVASTSDQFGWVLEASDNKVLVGHRKISGPGFATLFTCNYTSASLNECPTASWSERTFYANDSLANLIDSQYKYATPVSLSYNGFGYTVSINGNNMAVGSHYDTGLIPYGLTSSLIFGAVYFYNYQNAECASSSTDINYFVAQGSNTSSVDYEFVLTQKIFGELDHTSSNRFGREISIDGNFVAISSDHSTKYHQVDYISGSFILDGLNYQSTGSEDSVLGRVSIYNQHPDLSWNLYHEIHRNKDSNQPYNIFGRSVSMASDFLAVGAPIYNYVGPSSSYDLVSNHSLQMSGNFSPAYSGSVFIYELDDFKTNPLIGNIFYKNGYAVITNTESKFESIFTGTGSRGFDIKYQGTHTIFEHEYLVSVSPGEFNFSTNPTALVKNALLFDVNRDGVFDIKDLNLIMRYINNQKFYSTVIYYHQGIPMETKGWWKHSLLTEAGDVLLQEQTSVLLASMEFTVDDYNYIKNNLVDTGLLDIDGNGVIDMRDGAMLTQYYTDTLTPQSLLTLIDGKSTRHYVADIEKYISQFTGDNVFNVDPMFFGYQASSSFDPTGSYLAPYVTTIGLYDNNELVGVAKLGRPIKNLIDWPINFIVRFDT